MADRPWHRNRGEETRPIPLAFKESVPRTSCKEKSEIMEKIEPKLVVEHMSKNFGSVRAVKDVSLEIYPGEVRGLVGENGSGKSTLSGMITGALKPDGGTMTFNGKPYHPKSIIDAREKKIAILLQERGTLNGLTVAENMFIGMEDHFTTRFGVSKKQMQLKAREILESIGVRHINPADLVNRYTFEDRKIVEVARALFTDPEVLIVDETTSALSNDGREYIYKIIRQFKEEKKSVIFIGHDLDEIIRICDSASILKDGDYVTTLRGDDMDVDKMRSLMIGREFEGHYYRSDYKPDYDDEVVLRAEHLNYGPMIRDVSLELHKREILGICGLSDSGMHDLARALFGAYDLESGEVTLVKGNVKITDTSTAVKNKMAYLPKDRDSESLFLPTSIKDNIAVTCYDRKALGPIINKRHMKRIAEKERKELNIKCSDINQYGMELSGGNKQKVVVGKWLACDSELLIMDCPTRGIDVGVKADIYDLMTEMKKAGKSIIMLSEEMAEVIGMADRIIVIKDGAISGEFMRSRDLTEEVMIQKII